jgi:hypothetical protein
MNDKQIMLIEDNADDRDLTIRARKKNNVFNPSPSPATAPKPSQCFSGRVGQPGQPGAHPARP